MLGAGSRRALAALLLASSGLPGCRALDSFSTQPGEAYEGVIVDAPEFRRGDDTTAPPVLGAGTTMSLTLNVGDLQSTEPGGAGTVTTGDGLLAAAPLLPIGPLWRDTLSGLTFPDGRLRTVLYFVEGSTGAPGGRAGERILVVLSLMVDGAVELRLIGGPDPDGLYGVFRLRKTQTDGG